MEVIVVDASIAAKWFAPEPGSSDAMALAASGREMHAPDFLLLEMDNVLLTWVRRGMIDRPCADAARARLRQSALLLHPFAPLLDSAYVIANETGASVYDALYVALAERLDAELVTADERLVRSLARTRFARRVVSLRGFARRK